MLQEIVFFDSDLAKLSKMKIIKNLDLDHNAKSIYEKIVSVYDRKEFVFNSFKGKIVQKNLRGRKMCLSFCVSEPIPRMVNKLLYYYIFSPASFL